MTSATDNRTTELLPCPLCNGKIAEPLSKRWTNCLGDESWSASIACPACNLRIETRTVSYETERDAIKAVVEKWNNRTPEQAIAATLGSDASAVRLVEKLRGIADEMRNVGASSMKPHELLACYAAEVDKVADLMKYAATLGNGTCRNEWAKFGKFRCSECWTQVDAITTNTTQPMPIRYCPNCGRRVER